MAGVRITHPTARNARFTIVDKSRVYEKPYTCTNPLLGGCGSTHLFKTHHLNVDDTGAVIVDTALFGQIKHLLLLNGFTVANEVAKPPAMTLGMAHGRVRLIGQASYPPIIQGEGS